MPAAITRPQPAASAIRSQTGGGSVFSTQSSQHNAKAVHSGKVSRMIGRSPPVLASGSGSPRCEQTQMVAATAVAIW